MQYLLLHNKIRKPNFSGCRKYDSSCVPHNTSQYCSEYLLSNYILETRANPSLAEQQMKENLYCPCGGGGGSGGCIGYDQWSSTTHRAVGHGQWTRRLLWTIIPGNIALWVLTLGSYINLEFYHG